MTLELWVLLAGFALTFISVIGAASWKLLAKIEASDGLVRAEMHTVETKWAASQAKADLDSSQFREWVGNEFLRRREYEIAQQNTERRLVSIETKLDRIPESLERQSDKLIQAFKDSSTKEIR